MGGKCARTRADQGLARLIRQETRGGDEVVEFMVSVFRGVVPIRTPQASADPKSGRKAAVASRVIRYVLVPLRLRVKAAEWLADRGWGKSPVVLDEVKENEQPQIDLSSLTDEELAVFVRIVEKGQVTGRSAKDEGTAQEPGDTRTV